MLFFFHAYMYTVKAAKNDVHLLHAALPVYMCTFCAQGSLGETLKDVRPTAFLGVPRVWEKMQEKMREVGKSVTGMKKRIAEWAKGVGYRGSMSKMNGYVDERAGVCSRRLWCVVRLLHSLQHRVQVYFYAVLYI